MEKDELLEKLVEVQEQHIELMNDLNSLNFNYEMKIEKINDLVREIEQQSEEIGAQAEKIEALEVENAELKKQIEILQQSLITTEEK